MSLPLILTAARRGPSKAPRSGTSKYRDIRRWVRWMLLLALALAGWGNGAASAQEINREYTLKAVFLYKFTTYTHWPAETFADAESPLVIGILGPNPVGRRLGKIAAVKKIDGRKIEVRNYSRPQDVRRCHILFISRGLKKPTPQAAIKQLSGRHILFVGETPDFLEQGGVIAFVIQENRVKLVVSKSAYEREKLTISAQLLRVATVVN